MGKARLSGDIFSKDFCSHSSKEQKKKREGKKKKKGEIRKVEKKTTAEVRREYYRLF